MSTVSCATAGCVTLLYFTMILLRAVASAEVESGASSRACLNGGCHCLVAGNNRERDLQTRLP